MYIGLVRVKKYNSLISIVHRENEVLQRSCFLGIAAARQPDAPHHSADQLPDTEFSCRDKVLGGYYADPDAQCQMFHVCVKVAGVGVNIFLTKH